MANIIIQVDMEPNGNGFEISPLGQAGPGCLKATKGLEDRLGVVGERTLLPSYHEKPPADLAVEVKQANLLAL